MVNWLFKKVFSQWIPFKWIDGNKKEIARWAAFISAVALIVQQFFPEYAPFLEGFDAKMAILLSLIGIEVATKHDEVKGG